MSTHARDTTGRTSLRGVETLARRDAVPTGGRPGRWLVVLAGLALVAVLVPSVSWVIDERARAERCDALTAHVDGLTTARWTNGLTESEPAWISVLLAYSEIDGPTREAARADVAGFERMLAALPEELKPEAAHLHRGYFLRPSPEDFGDGRANRGASLLAGHAVEGCGIAP